MTKILAANWKLNKTPSDTKKFFTDLKAQNLSPEIQWIFFPPATSLETTAAQLQGTVVGWGAQNCYSKNQGAFTGEISAAVIAEMGGQFILIGHSERRQYFSETDQMISEKIKTIQSLSLTPILCIGESLEQRQSGKTLSHLTEQLQKGLSLASPAQKLVVAYEPIWAIGTGQVATRDQVLETHAQVRDVLNKMGFTQTAILYGGSVKADNALELSRVPFVDGFLVGGASLEVASLMGIAQGLL